jgi:hypothetical protein
LTPAAPLATAYNPLAPVTITDNGIAYATTYDSTGVPILILLVNRIIQDAFGNTLFKPVLTFDIPDNCSVLTYKQVYVPAPSNTYVTAYGAYWA